MAQAIPGLYALFDMMNLPGTASSTASGTASGSSAGGSSQGWLPGQSARFTPDPTVNGPWTHTRAEIPLFKSAMQTAPATGGAPTNAIPQRPTIPPNAQPRPQRPQWGGSPQQQQYRTAMDTWRGQRPDKDAFPAKPAFRTAKDSWRDSRPQRSTYRSMLADALSGKP